MTTVGCAGSSLVIVRLHDFGPAEVGVKLMPIGRLASGLIAAGNSPGLTSVKSEQLIIADATWSVQVPKLPLPVTSIMPEATLHVTVSGVLGLIGSLLAMLKVALLAPNEVGVQARVKLKLASGLMLTGKVGPVASEISVLPEERVMLLISRLSAPVSDTSSCAEPVDPSQTFPIESGFGLRLICGASVTLKKIAWLLETGSPSAAPLPVKTP